MNGLIGAFAVLGFFSFAFANTALIPGWHLQLVMADLAMGGISFVLNGRKKA